jgi:hypothetical protein
MEAYGLGRCHCQPELPSCRGRYRLLIGTDVDEVVYPVHASASERSRFMPDSANEHA